MNVELVRTVTRDGLRLDGALVAEQKRGALNAALPTAAILLHGVAGNFYTSSTFEPLIARLTEVGIVPLLVNTRGHDSVFGAMAGNMRRRCGAAYEIVDDCRQDVAAWIHLLKSRGYQRIVLIGHSLGAVKAVYAQANEAFAAVTAVVAVSAPRLSFSAFMNAADSSVFWESMRTADQMVKAGQGEDLFTSQYPVPLLMTAAAFLDKYGPAERYNLIHFADRIVCPALFTYGAKELASGGIAFAGVPEALQALPRGDRRTIAVIEAADHLYTGVAQTLAERIIQWLRTTDSAGNEGVGSAS